MTSLALNNWSLIILHVPLLSSYLELLIYYATFNKGHLSTIATSPKTATCYFAAVK